MLTELDKNILVITNHFLKSLKSYIVLKLDQNKYCILWRSPAPESIGRSYDDTERLDLVSLLFIFFGAI
jgi:hypothetical protein